MARRKKSPQFKLEPPRGGIRYWDRQGHPILDVLTWGKLRTPENAIVAQTTLWSGIWVSTVWLGMDHGFGQHKRPIIFETMVFPTGLNMRELYCRRYATEDQAWRGHRRAVQYYSGNFVREWLTGDLEPRDVPKLIPTEAEHGLTQRE